MSKKKKLYYGLGELQEEVRKAINDEISCLIEKLQQIAKITETGDVIPLDAIIAQVISNVRIQLEETIRDLGKIQYDWPSLIKGHDDDILKCQHCEYDDDLKRIKGSECNAQATVVGRINGENGHLYSYCDKHFKEYQDWEWQWWIRFPFSDELLKKFRTE